MRAERSDSLRRLVRAGLLTGVIDGLFSSVHRPPAITYRWWIQFVGHIPFVAVPIVASFASYHFRAVAPKTFVSS